MAPVLKDDDDDPGPSTKLVRSFSDELTLEDPKDYLARGLAAKVKQDREQEQRLVILRNEWQLLFRDAQQLAHMLVPDEEIQLLEKSRALFLAWERFQQQLPPDQRQNVREQPPSLKFLFETVQKASATWKDKYLGTKHGRLKRVFTRMCKVFNDHSQLMAIIPSDDKYICLLTGSLSAIALATINHEKIAEGVADGLKQLSDDLVFWSKLLGVHGDSPIMQGCIRELYVVIFEFLTDIFVEWSSSGWHRLVNSFNKNAFDRLFTSKRAQMDAIAARLDREANLETQKRIREMYDDQLKLLQSNRDHAAELKALALDLGSKSQRFLEELHSGRTSYSIVPRATKSETQVLVLEDIPDVESNSDDSPLAKWYGREDLLTAISVLNGTPQSQYDQLAGIMSNTSHLVIDARIADRLRSWTKSSKSDRLWIQGPHGTTTPSQNTLTAASLVALAKRHGIVTISYFCSLAGDGRCSSDKGRPSDSLSEMISALILQVVEQLPPKFSTELDLGSDRLRLVDCRVGSNADKLNLLRSLRKLLSKFLICVIDSVQMLEDRSDREHTRRLLQSIYCLCNLDNFDSDADVVTKVCFTTDGYVDILGAAARADALDKISYELEAGEMHADDANMMGDAGFG